MDKFNDPGKLIKTVVSASPLGALAGAVTGGSPKQKTVPVQATAGPKPEVKPVEQKTEEAAAEKGAEDEARRKAVAAAQGTRRKTLFAGKVAGPVSQLQTGRKTLLGGT